MKKSITITLDEAGDVKINGDGGGEGLTLLEALGLLEFAKQELYRQSTQDEEK